MMKRKLGIVNSTSINMSYGGVAPFIKNLDPFMQDEYDVQYIVLPASLTRINIIPRRLIFLLYLLGKKKQLNGFDVILSHVPEGSFMVSYGRIPFIHIFHGNFNPMSQSRYWYGKYFMSFFEWMEKRVIRKASLMYTVGVERKGIPKIFNPVLHHVKIKSNESRSGFIFSGRLEKIKNIDRLIEIYAKLPQSIRDDNPFYIAGVGTREAVLKKLVSSLGMDSKIIFLGDLKNEEMVETDSSKRIMTMASSQEGMPMAIAEALSVGVPVISTDTGDIARIIKSNENGFLLPLSFTDEEYIRCIRVILDDYERFAKNALASAEIFRSEKIAAGLINDINSVILKK
jgi:glycosyltransferase involved in cell wall biosynthesis